jgi:hypothetical protein
MTTYTIRDHCAAQVNDVTYLLECIEDGSSDPITLQDIADRANTARAALAAESAGEVPTPAEIDELTQQHTSDLGDLRIGVAPEDVPALVHAALARWGRPATPPAPRPEGDWFAVAVVAQDMRSRGLAEQACGEELLKLANSNRFQPARPAAPSAPRHPQDDERLGARTDPDRLSA